MHGGATNYYEGKWRPSLSGKTFESIDPANTDRVIGTYARSETADIEKAVSSAANAYDAWRRTPAPKRGAILFRMGQLL